MRYAHDSNILEMVQAIFYACLQMMQLSWDFYVGSQWIT